VPDLVIAQANQVLASGEILGTIVLPRNLNVLGSRLPKANYNSGLKKNPSMPGDLHQKDTAVPVSGPDSARKPSSSQQQHRPVVKNPALCAIQEAPIRNIPVSSPSSQDKEMARNAKNINNQHKPVIKARPVINSSPYEKAPLPPRGLYF